MAQAPSTRSDTAIDVSHWQGKNVDWAKVKAAGKLVAMIKATQGTGTDDTWAINAPAARAAGLAVIPYMFASNEPAQRQADYFAVATRLSKGMAVAIDWEGNGAPPAATVEAIGLALKKVTGRDPLGYWGLNPPGTPTAVMKAWPRWIPRYGVNNGRIDNKHPVNASWLFWQYTSAATVNGVAGHVDLSVFAGSDAALLAWCRTGDLPV